jgi:hypothetical protein
VKLVVDETAIGGVNLVWQNDEVDLSLLRNTEKDIVSLDLENQDLIYLAVYDLRRTVKL